MEILQLLKHNRQLYLDLMERCLINTIYQDQPFDPWSGKTFNLSARLSGRDWPSVAHSMIGGQRMNNLRVLCETVLKENIAGDFIETGVWRGGACILMRAAIAAYGDSNRNVWVADSFQGLPPPDEEQFPADKDDQHHQIKELAVSEQEVRQNFSRYNLLDNQVKFLVGWFKDTLPSAPISALSILRLDGDMYESTITALKYLYPKLSTGGFVIVDDFNLSGCSKAVNDFREQQGINDPIVSIDGMGSYWRKS